MSDYPREITVVCQLFYPESVSTGQIITELMEELSLAGFRIVVIASQPTVVKGQPAVSRHLQHHGMDILRTWSTRLPKNQAFGKALNLATFFLSAALDVLRRRKGTVLVLLTNPRYLPLLGAFCDMVRRQD